MPPFGDARSTPEEETQTTRTVLGGEDAAVEARMGVRSLVKRKGAMLLVPSWSS